MAKKTETATVNYSAQIVESSRELSPKERVMYKDFGNARKLNEWAEECEANGIRAIITEVQDWAVISVHNEGADNPDYNVYLVVDNEGTKYYTSSEAFFTRFKDIESEMKESDESWGIEINLVPSKKYSGKKALTCSLI